ncbi:ABC transporter permease [Uliginosibacterium sp. H3]|uniref:ABC transporter permease n=1 Tax=Uliginosibacterium silvisoli TaxID=3114758 RepID=A0ABU6K7M7_9RHOO|nr:ABC transporter permease [Uliginosibacterium sp. H3]
MPSAELTTASLSLSANGGEAAQHDRRFLRRLASLASKVFDRTAVLLLLAAVWEVAPRVGLTDPVFLPPLSEVLAAGWQLTLKGQLTEHLGASLGRALVGFLLAIVIAIPLGLLIGWVPRVANFLNPLIEVLRNTAPLALLPVFILLLGIGEVSKISLVVYSAAWPLLINTIGAVRQVDPLFIKAARTMGATPLQLFHKVILPAALPSIFVGVRIASASAVLVLVAAEMVGAKAGLGFLIIYSQYNFQIDLMYFGILAITSIGLAFNYALLWLERRFTGWKISADAKG